MTENPIPSDTPGSNKPIHVLMLNYEYPPMGGGGGVATQTLIFGLAKLGVSVTLVTSSPDQRLHQEQPQAHLTLIRLPVKHRQSLPVASLWSLWSYIKQVKRWMQTVKQPTFSLVHSQFAVPTGLAGRLLAKRWQLPHVVTVHGFDIHDPTRSLSPDTFPPMHWLVQRVLSSAASVTTQSQDIAQRTRSGYRLPTDLTIIPLGIPKVNIPVQPPPPSPTTFTLVGVGRLVKRKGFDLALQALAKLPPDIQLLIIGDGPERERLVRLTQSLGLTSRVQLVGSIHDEQKWNLLAQSDIYLLPSLHEGFSLSTVEAMMMGLPVIASNTGGQTDFLQPQTNALLVPPEPEKIAQAVLKLYHDQELRTRMKHQNILLANQLTDEVMAKRYHHLYANLLSQ